MTKVSFIGLYMIMRCSTLLWRCHAKGSSMFENWNIGILLTLDSMIGVHLIRRGTKKLLFISDRFNNLMNASVRFSKRCIKL